MQKLFILATILASCGPGNDAHTLSHEREVPSTLYAFRYNARPLAFHKAYAVANTYNQPLNASCYYTFDALVQTEADPIDIIRAAKPYGKTFTNNIAFMESHRYQSHHFIGRIWNLTFLDSVLLKETMTLNELRDVVLEIAKRFLYTRRQLLHYLNLALKFAPDEFEGGIKCPERYPLDQL